MMDVQMRWVCWERAGHRVLEYRTKQEGATDYGEWRAVPEVDATHPAITPAEVSY